MPLRGATIDDDAGPARGFFGLTSGRSPVGLGGRFAQTRGFFLAPYTGEKRRVVR